MKKFKDLVAEHEKFINEIMPWDLADKLSADTQPLLLDIREPEEFFAMHIKNAMNTPRGILEAACEYDYSETVPELVAARNKEVIVICRSGNRSVLAAYTMQQLGYKKVMSLKTGLKGWNDYEQCLVDNAGNEVSNDVAEIFLNPKLSKKQLTPK